MATRKILTITIEFEMADGTVMRIPRLKSTRDVAVEAAVRAAHEALENGLTSPISAVTSRTTWDYRWLDSVTAFPLSDEEDAEVLRQIAEQAEAASEE